MATVRYGNRDFDKGFGSDKNIYGKADYSRALSQIGSKTYKTTAERSTALKNYVADLKKWAVSLGSRAGRDKHFAKDAWETGGVFDKLFRQSKDNPGSTAERSQLGIDLGTSRAGQQATKYGDADYYHGLAVGQGDKDIREWLGKNPGVLSATNKAGVASGLYERIRQHEIDDRFVGLQKAWDEGLSSKISGAVTSATQGLQSKLNTATTDLGNLKTSYSNLDTRFKSLQTSAAQAAADRSKVRHSGPSAVSGAGAATGIKFAQDTGSLTGQGRSRGTLANLTRSTSSGTSRGVNMKISNLNL